MDELYHHGILGMKWGIRRYQNEDGSRTIEGLEHLRETRAQEQNIEIRQRKPLLSKNAKDAIKYGAMSAAVIATPIAARYVKKNAKTYLKKAGKQAAISILKSTPKVPLYAIKGSAKTMQTGMAIMKIGASITKIGAGVAKAGIKTMM